MRVFGKLRSSDNTAQLHPAKGYTELISVQRSKEIVREKNLISESFQVKYVGCKLAVSSTVETLAATGMAYEIVKKSNKRRLTLTVTNENIFVTDTAHGFGLANFKMGDIRGVFRLPQDSKLFGVAVKGDSAPTYIVYVYKCSVKHFECESSEFVKVYREMRIQYLKILREQLKFVDEEIDEVCVSKAESPREEKDASQDDSTIDSIASTNPSLITVIFIPNPTTTVAAVSITAEATANSFTSPTTTLTSSAASAITVAAGSHVETTTSTFHSDHVTSTVGPTTPQATPASLLHATSLASITYSVSTASFSSSADSLSLSCDSVSRSVSVCSSPVPFADWSLARIPFRVHSYPELDCICESDFNCSLSSPIVTLPLHSTATTVLSRSASRCSSGTQSSWSSDETVFHASSLPDLSRMTTTLRRLVLVRTYSCPSLPLPPHASLHPPGRVVSSPYIFPRLDSPQLSQGQSWDDLELLPRSYSWASSFDSVIYLGPPQKADVHPASPSLYTVSSTTCDRSSSDETDPSTLSMSMLATSTRPELPRLDSSSETEDKCLSQSAFSDSGVSTGIEACETDGDIETEDESSSGDTSPLSLKESGFSNNVYSVSSGSVKMLAEWAKLKLPCLSDIFTETDKSPSVDQIRVHVDPVPTQPELSLLSEVVSGESKGQSPSTSLPRGSMSMPAIFAQPGSPRSFKRTGKKSSSESQARVASVPGRQTASAQPKRLPHLEPFNIIEKLGSSGSNPTLLTGRSLNMPLTFALSELPTFHLSSDDNKGPSEGQSPVAGELMNVPTTYMGPELPQSSETAEEQGSSDDPNHVSSMPGGLMNMPVPSTQLELPQLEPLNGTRGQASFPLILRGPMNTPTTTAQPELPPTSETSDETERQSVSRRIASNRHNYSYLSPSVPTAASLTVSIITPSMTSPQNVDEEEEEEEFTGFRVTPKRRITPYISGLMEQLLMLPATVDEDDGGGGGEGPEAQNNGLF